MTITTYTNHKELRPDEGKVLYDGMDVTTAVAAPIDADISKWQEIDPPEPEDEITAEEALNIITGEAL